ncbi:MAG: 16S rRNA (cytosine(1402)-N(4))-methyltransferase RsmH [Pirellulales bacterium]
MTDSTIHIPVLLREILEYGKPQPGGTWMDGTGGGGGHSAAIAELLGPSGRLLTIDRDPAAAERLTRLLPHPPCAVKAASYDDAPELLQALDWGPVDGILLDLGLSSDQLNDRERGFSFATDGELDMRFDPTSGYPVWQWMNRVPERELADVIYKYGEERFSRRIARRIVEHRMRNPIRTAAELRELIHRCVPSPKQSRLDPATRTFQALRIVINDELGILERAMMRLPDLLAPGGQLLVISFHSLEDRIVKYAFRDDPRLEVVTRKPLTASDVELEENHRARSAKLRIARRIDGNAGKD